MPMPGFDEKTFPFVISSGREFFNILNVRDYKMQALIRAPCMNIRCQQAFFFKKEENGYSMHFTTTELTTQNLIYQNWHVLRLKEDFMTTIRQYGELPISSFKKQLDISE